MLSLGCSSSRVQATIRLKGRFAQASPAPPYSQRSAVHFLPRRVALSLHALKAIMKDSPCVPRSCQTLAIRTKSSIRTGTSSFMCLQVTLKIRGQKWKDPRP